MLAVTVDIMGIFGVLEKTLFLQISKKSYFIDSLINLFCFALFCCDVFHFIIFEPWRMITCDVNEKQHLSSKLSCIWVLEFPIILKLG